MDVNTSSLIFQKLEDKVLVRILSLTTVLLPNDLFWMNRFRQRYKVDLGKYAKMSYYDIYRDLVTSEQDDAGKDVHILRAKFTDILRFGKKGWFHKKLVERGYTPFIDQLIKDNNFHYGKHHYINRRHDLYIGPLISATEFGHLELIERFRSEILSNFYIKHQIIQIAIKHGFMDIFQYLLNFEHTFPEYLHSTTETIKILHESIKYDRYEIFEYILKMYVLRTGHSSSRTIKQVPGIGGRDIISWIINIIICNNRLDFLERFIANFNIELTIKQIIHPLIKNGTSINVSLEFFLYLLDLLPKDYIQHMIDDIIDRRNPTSSRPFLSLFQSFGDNVEIYKYLLTKYSKLPYYFLQKIIRYQSGHIEVLKMIFGMYPELHLQHQTLIDDCKGRYRKQLRSSIRPLIELLVEHNPSIDLKKKSAMVDVSSYYSKRCSTFKLFDRKRL